MRQTRFPCPRENMWYYVDSPRAREELDRRIKDIDVLIPFWYGITEEGDLVGEPDQEVVSLAREHNVPILAIIHNFADPAYANLIHLVLTTPSLRENLVTSIHQMLEETGFLGVNIDFEFVPPNDRVDLNAFMAELYNRLAPDYVVTISVPARLEDDPDHPFSGAFDYATLARYSHQLMILAYDEHFTIPGPVASVGFVRRVLNFAITQIPRPKIVLGMPVYGYEWPETGGIPRSLTHSMAVAQARLHEVPIVFDPVAMAPTYTYTANGINYIVWFEDARSFSAKLRLVREYNLPGIAVWRLSQEDPRVWRVIRDELDLCRPYFRTLNFKLHLGFLFSQQHFQPAL